MNLYYIDSQIQDPDLLYSVGVESYGKIIFNKESLYKRLERSLDDRFSIVSPDDSSIKKNEVHIKWSSNIVFTDLLIQKLFLEKLHHCSMPFMWGNKDSYIFKGTNVEFEYFQQSRVKLDDSFIIIKDLVSFHFLIDTDFDTRYFNKIYKDADKYIKKSTKRDKLRNEFNFLNNLPQEIASYYIPVDSFSDDGNEAQYTMPKINFLDVSQRHINGNISQDDADVFFKSLDSYLTLVKNKTFRRTGNEFLFIYEKTLQRYEDLKEISFFDKLESLIANHTSFGNIHAIYKKLFSLLESSKTEINEAGSILSHGDLCFSNILASKYFDKLVFIDPLGGNIRDAHKSIYYDFAKLSHSIHGNYDLINNNLSRINFNSEMNISLDYHKEENIYLFKKFEQLSSSFGLSSRLLRLIEASLFLSMLPLHKENEQKVNMLAIRGIEILNDIN
tara:strand:- start:1726 stop:3060 length:1335 start_codon:yes stop_codon:yes gene_type:complete